MLLGHVLLFVLLGRIYLCEAGFPFGHVLLSDGLIMFLFEFESLFGHISLVGPFVHVSLFGAGSPHGA